MNAGKVWLASLWIVPAILAAAATADAQGKGWWIQNFGNENAGTTTVTAVVNTAEYKYVYQNVQGRLLGTQKRITASRAHADRTRTIFRFIIATESGEDGITVSGGIAFSRYTSPLNVKATIWVAPFLPVTATAGVGFGRSVNLSMDTTPALWLEGSAGLSGHLDVSWGVPGWRVGVRGFLEILNARLKVELDPWVQSATVVFSTMYVHLGIFAEALFGYFYYWHELTTLELLYEPVEIDLLRVLPLP